MQIGIFGGTFDPVHYGHLLLAESCREQLQLDEVWFLPAAIPPHKQQAELTSAAARIEMLQLAIGGQETFRVCSYEVEHGGVNYTVDTLAALAEEAPGRQLFFLMGADSLRDLPTWREPRRICELAIPIFVSRSLVDGESTSSATDLSGLETLVDPARLDLIRKHHVEMPRIDLSSSEIRSRVAQGRSIRYQTPRAVERYIATHGLYRSAADRRSPR